MHVAHCSSHIAVALLLAALPLAAQQPPSVVQEHVDLAVMQRIREEGLTRSHVDSLAEYLTDVIGPRLTGSGGMRRANEWTAQMFRQWGLANVRIEPWDSSFGRGWERVSYGGRILEPFLEPLSAQPLAWSGSTRGSVTCPVVLLDVTDTTQLAQYEGRLKGACVLRGAPRDVRPSSPPSCGGSTPTRCWCRRPRRARPRGRWRTSRRSSGPNASARCGP